MKRVDPHYRDEELGVADTPLIPDAFFIDENRAVAWVIEVTDTHPVHHKMGHLLIHYDECDRIGMTFIVIEVDRYGWARLVPIGEYYFASLCPSRADLRENARLMDRASKRVPISELHPTAADLELAFGIEF